MPPASERRRRDPPTGQPHPAVPPRPPAPCPVRPVRRVQPTGRVKCYSRRRGRKAASSCGRAVPARMHPPTNWLSSWKRPMRPASRGTASPRFLFRAAPAAEARSAPIAQTLGWLVGVGAGLAGDRIGPSLRWAGEIAHGGRNWWRKAAWFRSFGGTGSNGASSRQGLGRQRVRWVPALVGRDRLHDLVTRMPTSVVALQPAAQADAVCRSVLAAVVDAISRAGAARLVRRRPRWRPAPRTEIAEAVLSAWKAVRSWRTPTWPVGSGKTSSDGLSR